MSLLQFLNADGINRTPVSAATPLPVTGTFEAAAGGATEAKQDAAAILVGAVTETAPATDTASSGLNGRLQRIAQRITSLIALVPASLGAKTAAASFSVTTATDDSSLTALALLGTEATLADLRDLMAADIDPADVAPLLDTSGLTEMTLAKSTTAREAITTDPTGGESAIVYGLRISAPSAVTVTFYDASSAGNTLGSPYVIPGAGIYDVQPTSWPLFRGVADTPVYVGLSATVAVQISTRFKEAI